MSMKKLIFLFFLLLQSSIVIGQLQHCFTPLNGVLIKNVTNTIQFDFSGNDCSDYCILGGEKDTIEFNDSCQFKLFVSNTGPYCFKVVNRKTKQVTDTVTFLVMEIPSPEVYLSKIDRRSSYLHSQQYSSFDTLRFEFPAFLQFENKPYSIVGFNWAISINGVETRLYNNGPAFSDFRSLFNSIHRGDYILIITVDILIEGVNNTFLVNKNYKF